MNMEMHYSIKDLVRRFIASLLFMTLLLTGHAVTAQNTSLNVKGTVTSSEDGIPLPGVSIVLKGTITGTITDFDGTYDINVPNGTGSLVLSYLGFETQEISVSGRATINVVMALSTEALDEVVVTALGIKREDKSLGYSVEKVVGQELTRVANPNVLNSLSGKVSGVTINNTGGTGSSVSMVIRGAISLSSDNQPLFVIDGVPVENTLNNIGGFGERNEVDYGNAISDLDPASVENVTILKGASAAALYGTRAGNGVVLITTKRAKPGEKMKIEFTSNTVFDVPYKFIDTQSRFAPGYLSYSPATEGGSMIMPDAMPAGGNGGGPELDVGYFAVQWDSPLDANGNPIPTALKSYPKNIRNFVNTGITTTNSLAISNSSQWLNVRFGVSTMDNTGIIPNSDMQRNSYNLTASSNLNNKLTFSTSVNFVHSYAKNRPASNRGTNPLDAAYHVPASINIMDIKDYKLPGNKVYNFSDDYANPWFMANEVNNGYSRYRLYGNMALEWNITPEFSVRSSYNLNTYNQTEETKMAPGFNREPNNGTYGIAKSDGLETNVDFLATYTKKWEGFDLSVSGGGNLMYQKHTGLSNSAANKAGLIVPNLYTVSNIAPAALVFSSYASERGINSIYGLANFGFWNMLYLDLTARNDWSSTLPIANRSYFYPSASASFLLNEVVEIPKVNLLKLRAGYAVVGNDTNPYQLDTYYNNNGIWGNAIMYGAGSLNTPTLEPEEANSMEYGMDLTMFGNRLRFSGTYYVVENKNQIIRVPISPSSGSTSVGLNAGSLESKGYELSLGLTPVKTQDWKWDLDFNFTKNESKIKELAEGVTFIQFWDENKSFSRGYVANPETGEDGLVGNIYSPRIKRVTDINSPYYNYPILGKGEDATWTASEEKVKVGNYNPDFIMGLQSRLSYKNFTLNMTFDWRSGGQYMSQTARYLADDGYSNRTLNSLVNPGISEPGPELKQWVLDHADEFIFGENFLSIGGTPGDGGFPEKLSGRTVNDGIFNAGVRGSYDNDGTFIVEHVNDGDVDTDFIPFSLQNPWDMGTVNMFDADYIKLREISLSYNLPNKFIDRMGISNLVVSLYSRNIMLWTKDSAFGVDPERAFQADRGKGNRGTQFMQGIERYNVEPWLVPIGLKIGVTF